MTDRTSSVQAAALPLAGCSTVFFSLAWEVVALSAVSFFIDVVVLVFESDSSVLLVMPVIIPSDFWAEEEFFFFFACVVSFLGMEETTVFLEGTDVAGIIIAAVAVGFGADVWFVVCPLSGVDTGEVISNESSEEKSPPSRSPSIGFERTRAPFCSRQRILEVRFSFVNFTYRYPSSSKKADDNVTPSGVGLKLSDDVIEIQSALFN